MKRSEFFKRLGLGVAAIAVAPKVLAEVVKDTPTLVTGFRSHKFYKTDWKILDDPDFLKNNRMYPYTPKQVLDIYHNTGVVLSNSYDYPAIDPKVTEELLKHYGKKSFSEVAAILSGGKNP